MSSCKLFLRILLYITAHALNFSVLLFLFFLKIAIASISSNGRNCSSFHKLNRLLCYCTRQYKTHTFRIFFSKEDKNGALTYNNRAANFEHSSSLCIFGKFVFLPFPTCKHNIVVDKVARLQTQESTQGYHPTPANLNYKFELANLT